MRSIITQMTACTIVLMTMSCGETQPVETSPQPGALNQASAAAQPKRTEPAQRNPSAAQPGANAGTLAPPRDAQWTIVCRVISGPGHVATARQLRDDLIAATRLKDWYVSHDEQQSTLFFGYYRTYNDPGDPKETARIHADRERIAKMVDNIGNRPFAEARPVAISTPDPTAPPELNLANVRGAWSLQIAVYQGAGRKEAAIEAVKEARKLGVEAFYHHGPTVSAVCIGAWPEEAIRKQELDGGSGVNVRDQQQPLLVLGPGVQLPKSLREQYSTNLIDRESGRKVQVLEQKVEVLDPTLRAAMEKYPTYAVNGEDQFTQERDPNNGRIVRIAQRSLIVPIPQIKSVFQSDPVAPSLLAPTAAPPRGTGQLRSVEP